MDRAVIGVSRSGIWIVHISKCVGGVTGIPRGDPHFASDRQTRYSSKASSNEKKHQMDFVERFAVWRQWRALYFLWDVFGFADNFSTQIAALGLNASNWQGFIIYCALVNPFVEEYFWRGYLGNKTKSLHTSDFLFAGFHALVLINKVQVGSIVFGLCMLVLAGWFWRQIAREDEGLLAPVLGHMAADLTILVTVYKMAA